MQKSTKELLIILLISVVVGTTVYFVINPKLSIFTQVSADKQALNSNVQTADWKTYTNNNWKTYVDQGDQFTLKYPISLQYPPNWKVASGNKDAYKFISLVGDAGTVNIFITDSDRTTLCETQYEKVKINGEQFDFCDVYDNGSEVWWSEKGHDDFGINIEATANKPYLQNRETILNILSTFKFTDTNQTSGCGSDADCKAGERCMTEGPLIAGQPVHKTCVGPNQAIPL